MKKKIVLVLLLIVVLTGAFLGYQFFKPAISNQANKYLYIESDDNVETVKQKLVKAGYIKPGGFDLVARLLKYKEARPGRYKLKYRGNLFNLVRDLRNGKQAIVK